jgi:hypothetical protein
MKENIQNLYDDDDDDDDDDDISWNKCLIRY